MRSRYARTLLAQDGSARTETAEELVSEAHAIFLDLGMEADAARTSRITSGHR